MLRFYYIIIVFFPLVIYYLLVMEHYINHREKYDEVKCYDLAQRLIARLKKKARIVTISYGAANLPQNCGYIMYSNHQGKYDALGIISSHEKPCSVVMDEERSKLIVANQFIELLDGVRLNRTDYKQQLYSAKKIQDDVEHGKKYIYFPEGKYERNGNNLQEFRPGAFRCAKRAKAPIVPVAIYDSHIPFENNSLRKVTTQVCFLEPIYYDEYRDKTTQEIGQIVKERIEDCLEFLEETRIDKKWNLPFYQ